MLWLDVGRYRVPLSTVLASQSQRAHHLSRLYKEGARATCLCTSQGVQMGVARRADHATYYLYHLHLADQGLHAKSCPHFAPVPPAEATPAAQYTPPAPVTATAAAGSAATLHPLGVATLLDRLVAGAGLNHWSPGFIKKRAYHLVRYRLIAASVELPTPAGQAMRDSLYVPPTWDPSTRQLAEEEWAIFVEMMRASTDTQQRWFVLGLVRSLEVRPEWSAPKLLLAAHSAPFWLDNNPALIPYQAEECHSWLTLLELGPSESRAGYRVIDAAALLMSRYWIPVHSSVHAHLADDLAPNTRFVASLAHDESTKWAVPDLIITAEDGSTYRHGTFGMVRVDSPIARGMRPAQSAL